MPPQNKSSDPQSSTLNQSKDKESETSAERTYEPRAPFPNRLKPKQNAQMGQMREIFKQTKVNIPLLDAIEQVPAYAKILKDLCTKKRKTQVPKKVFLASPVTDMMSNSMPEKYSDPGCPTVTCTIGSTTIKRALLDLGAGVNLLPSSVYEQLGIGELKPTKITIQLADRTVRTPRGVVEDVLVKIGEFFFPVDFIVLETAPVQNPLNQTPVILGRPFLATANALIDYRGGVMRLTFGKMTREMNIFKFDGQISDQNEQAVNMIYQLRADQGKDDSDEEDVEETPQSFGEICNEEIRIFEEACEGEGWKNYTEDDDGDSNDEMIEERLDEEIRLFEMKSNEGDDELDLEDREKRFNEEFRLFEEKVQREHTGVRELFDELVIFEQPDQENSEESSLNNGMEKGRRLTHVGPQISNAIPDELSEWRNNDGYKDQFDYPVHSEWRDPYVEPAMEGCNTLSQPIEKEPAGLDLWLNSWDNMSTLDMPDTHSYKDPCYKDTGHFEQGERIFDHECKFFENLDPSSAHIDKDKCGENRTTVKLENTESAVENDELLEDQLGLDDKTESRTTGRVRWKKKKNARIRMSRSKRQKGKGGCFWSDNVVINSMRRTHYQSGKRSRGRNIPSLI